MFYNILDKKRFELLPLFKSLKKDYYLAGGTALALQIGHRDSIDFDFFSNKNINTDKLFKKLITIFFGHKLIKVQEEPDTLSVIIDESVKLSFLTYMYDLIDNSIEEDNLRLASIGDIGCMKLSAVTGRASKKDYIDLYYIFHIISLGDLLKKASEKFPILDNNLILKSLVYFNDVVNEPILFKNDNYIEFDEVKIFLEDLVKSYSVNLVNI